MTNMGTRSGASPPGGVTAAATLSLVSGRQALLTAGTPALLAPDAVAAPLLPDVFIAPLLPEALAPLPPEPLAPALFPETPPLEAPEAPAPPLAEERSEEPTSEVQSHF